MMNRREALLAGLGAVVAPFVPVENSHFGVDWASGNDVATEYRIEIDYSPHMYSGGLLPKRWSQFPKHVARITCIKYHNGRQWVTYRAPQRDRYIPLTPTRDDIRTDA